LLRRLADRTRPRSEATIQADVRSLLLAAGLGLGEDELDVQLETQVGDRRRIDVEVGYTVVEVKRDLRSAAVAAAARDQLAGYVATRESQTGQRYLGVLTDGATWIAYQLQDGQLTESTRLDISPARPDAAGVRYWLEGILATSSGVRPVPAEITARLGAGSAAHALDAASLAALYAAHRHEPTVALKRELWASLLTSALGTQFTDDAELFLEHTLLVNTAEIIAHLVLGLDVEDLQPATLLGGQRFETAGIHGVVEADFFDWVIEVPGGAGFIRTLARRLARFDWTAVEHDVLKVLYESVIGTATRKRLGEYYTPDWLADRVVDAAVTDPLSQRVLDPACGSGTFLFHAVRRYLAASEVAGQPTAAALAALPGRVIGVDLHPVAVALARVTYLLAIGRDRLVDPTRPAITVPVYLGDSVQWSQRLDLFGDGYLTIPTGSGDQLFDAELRFPEHLLDDAARFDALVTALADLAAKPRTPGVTPKLPTGLVQRLAIDPADLPVLQDNYALLCRLHDEDRDHIWGYYVRNLARPLWLTRPGHRVDVLVGNPPWLSYRYMPADMQTRFRQLCGERGLWAGAEVATQQDLSALFAARTIQQYLKDGGRFAFVMPNAVLDRDYYAGFRTGSWPEAGEPTHVAFGGSWDLRRLRPHFFPRGAAVVFGTRTTTATPLPQHTERWTGRLPRRADTWASVETAIGRESAALASRAGAATSPYGPRFANGATIFPRMLFFVTTPNAGPLGLAAGRQQVRSATSSTEKKPWKELPRLDGVVEAEFIRPVLLGESLLPHRLLPARKAVLPLEGSQLLDRDHPHLDLYPGLADWWHQAENTWTAHRSSQALNLRQQLDYRRKLTGQLPAAPLRVVYGKSGMHVAAALVEDRNAVIDHALYWATVTSREEGRYLCALLNSPVLTDLVRPLMSYGKDERHVDKHLWQLLIPTFDPADSEHQRLADLGAQATQLIADLPIDETSNFVTLRRHVRAALAASPVGQAADEMVTELLS
jgi:SAM-dependent methyltransferase